MCAETVLGMSAVAEGFVAGAYSSIVSLQYLPIDDDQVRVVLWNRS